MYWAGNRDCSLYGTRRVKARRHDVSLAVYLHDCPDTSVSLPACPPRATLLLTTRLRTLYAALALHAAGTVSLQRMPTKSTDDRWSKSQTQGTRRLNQSPTQNAPGIGARGIPWWATCRLNVPTRCSPCSTRRSRLSSHYGNLQLSQTLRTGFVCKYAHASANGKQGGKEAWLQSAKCHVTWRSGGIEANRY